MKKNFAESSVEIVDCPDLTQEPFNLAAPGELKIIHQIQKQLLQIYNSSKCEF